jgi:hypothetical protein
VEQPVHRGVQPAVVVAGSIQKPSQPLTQLSSNSWHHSVSLLKTHTLRSHELLSWKEETKREQSVRTECERATISANESKQFEKAKEYILNITHQHRSPATVASVERRRKHVTFKNVEGCFIFFETKRESTVEDFDSLNNTRSLAGSYSVDSSCGFCSPLICLKGAAISPSSSYDG